MGDLISNTARVAAAEAREMELAARVHYSFMRENYSDSHLDIAVRGRPYAMVGGDYSSILPLDDERLIVCMCDTVGHGIASALLAARVNTFVLTHVAQNQEPCSLMEELNAHLFDRLTGTGMYTTFALLYIDYKDSFMHFAGAAHPPLLHFKARTGEVEFIRSEATFLGVMNPLSERCPGKRQDIETGDRVILYTDGVTEAKSPDGESFGTGALEKFVIKNLGLTSEELSTALMEEVRTFSSGQFSDDVLIMTINVK